MHQEKLIENFKTMVALFFFSEEKKLSSGNEELNDSYSFETSFSC